MGSNILLYHALPFFPFSSYGGTRIWDWNKLLSLALLLGSCIIIFVLGDLSVDTASHQVMRGAREISLSGKEFAILEYLIRNQGTVLTRDAIEQHVWGYDYEGASNVVDVYIRYLRRKIDEGYPDKLLHTVRGAGYVLRKQG